MDCPTSGIWIELPDTVAGGIRAVDLASGKVAWSVEPQPKLCPESRTCRASQGAAVTVIPGAVLSGSLDGGMRAYSEAAWVTWEDVDWIRKEIIVRGHPVTGTKGGTLRRIPMLPDMEELLSRLKSGVAQAGAVHGKIMQVTCGREALAQACERVGTARITPHDLRHLFATRSIEAGVDIPTVSRWLGHKDGGALAMKVSGHRLRSGGLPTKRATSLLRFLRSRRIQ
jgi:integrase